MEEKMRTGRPRITKEEALNKEYIVERRGMNNNGFGVVQLPLNMVGVKVKLVEV